MNKPILVMQAPVFTRSGYGDHARDLLKALYASGKYEVKIVPTRWGNTPQNQINPISDFGKWVFSNIITQLHSKPDIFVQVTVANEFNPVGHFNIGITAGVETSIIPKDFIDGANKMDLVVVPSIFTKNLFTHTVYREQNKTTGHVINEIKLQKPIEVLFEGVDVDLFSQKHVVDGLDNVDTDFNFLFVGHWLRGDVGQDRKDVGMLIKLFASVFNTIPKNQQPGLILKTSQSGFSVIDREAIVGRIENAIRGIDNVPPIYLLHGDLSDAEMSGLYHHSKVKAMVSFTKGEGYGRPLAEFCMTGKPIIASNWSGHLDFLPKEHTVLIDGVLENVHDSAADKFLLKDSKWFTVNYTMASNALYDVYNKYDEYLKLSSGLKRNIKSNFSLSKMNDEFIKLIEKYRATKPTPVAFNAPTQKQMPFQLPKLNKVP